MLARVRKPRLIILGGVHKSPLKLRLPHTRKQGFINLGQHVFYIVGINPLEADMSNRPLVIFPQRAGCGALSTRIHSQEQGGSPRAESHGHT